MSWAPFCFASEKAACWAKEGKERVCLQTVAEERKPGSFNSVYGLAP